MRCLRWRANFGKNGFTRQHCTLAIAADTDNSVITAPCGKGRYRTTQCNPRLEQEGRAQMSIVGPSSLTRSVSAVLSTAVVTGAASSTSFTPVQWPVTYFFFKD